MMYVLSVTTGEYSDASTCVLGVYSSAERAKLCAMQAWRERFPHADSKPISAEGWEYSDFRTHTWYQSFETPYACARFIIELIGVDVQYEHILVRARSAE